MWTISSYTHLLQIPLIWLRDILDLVDTVYQWNTPPKFNIAPEKWWLEDYFPIGKVTFQGLC